MNQLRNNSNDSSDDENKNLDKMKKERHSSFIENNQHKLSLDLKGKDLKIDKKRRFTEGFGTNLLKNLKTKRSKSEDRFEEWKTFPIV
jgi:hypothetical protein